MRRVNLSAPPLETDAEDPEGFRAAMFRFGGQLGAQRTGMTLYDLPPGQAVCPYHYEYGEEEWVLVLDGHPSVRTPEGTERLDPMDAVFFPTGPEGAHQVRNDSDAPARVLMISELVTPSATAYPDSGKVGMDPGVPGEGVMVHRSASVDYYDGEPGVDA
jgi:uncharacterized cupin superfamily protein